MKVSIGIPFFNPGPVFREAIASVLNQTFEDFELILLDDGSSDNALSIAQSFADPRIKVISDGKNKGLPARLNELIELSSGDYIARMDADDLISPDRLQLQVNFLNTRQTIDLVSTGICSITDDAKVLGYRKPQESPLSNASISDAIYGRVNIAHATIMARKSWYQRNQYNETAKLMEDYQLWIDAAIKDDLNVGYIVTPLYFYREESSVSSRKAINAYKNQLSLVKENYLNYLSWPEKFKFTLTMRFKMLVVLMLNSFNTTNLLMSLRNKSTEQHEPELMALQQQLDDIRSQV
ncbi:glycosyltransferase family 2 protein [Thalassotalea sp. M1531]|uniref:Glycosyltransferase family 2 protein n=1 Tax=Thalassotalea algicola TaxID=2716224 RepID=A0A7Y0LB52_9GAMM|nr:glycosyltransferase family 2 protein [Thalassotalea algicola]NMP30451.1 glycosyltransferase family 2 protein [Thalassotalea algicola]